jgi:hypothetical protein
MIHVRGILLFAFIPLTLYLFVQHPLGIVISFSIGLFFMFTHRFAAAPFMERHREARCLWCGRAAPGRAAIDVATRRSARRFAVCGVRCEANVRAFAGFVDAHRRAIAVAIFVPLGYYLAAGFAAAAFGAGLPEEVNRCLLQAPIALTVVLVALLYRRGRSPQAPRVPFPIHNLFLLGIRATLAVFLVMGLVWLGQVALRLFDWLHLLSSRSRG